VSEGAQDLSFWECVSGQQIGKMPTGGKIVDFSRTRPYRVMAFAANAKLFAFEKRGEIVVIGLPALNAVMQIAISQAPWDMALSPDSRYLVADFGKNGKTIVWDIPDGKPIAAWDGNGRDHLAFEPSGRYLVSTGREFRAQQGKRAKCTDGFPYAKSAPED
jgi:WD40 repeat protein